MLSFFEYGWVAFGFETEPERRLNKNRRLAPQDRVFGFLLDPVLPAWLKPNHITIFRFMCIPPLLLLLSLGRYSIVVPAFIFLGLTDAIDGSLARVRGQISEWGIVFDPVSDKVLILSVVSLLVMVETNFWLGVALILAEGLVIINAWQLFGRNIIRQANFFGKLKMVCEVVGLSALLISKWFGGETLVLVSETFLVAAVFSALISVLWKRNLEN